MYYRLSNNYTIDDIKKVYGLDFKFPSIYEEKLIIDGLNEAVVPMVSQELCNTVDFGIWGILPQNFKEDWSVFQSARNTLNLNIEDIDGGNQNDQFGFDRRCCIMVSGFFASFYHKGLVYPIYVHSATKACFALAGVYNKTNDGFNTFTLLLKKSNSQMRRIQNISNHMPILLNQEGMSQWLNEGYHDILHNDYDNFGALKIKSHPIAREFFKNDIFYDSILEPVTYEKLVIDMLQ